MQPTSLTNTGSYIQLKLIDFFNSFDKSIKAKMYHLLTDELVLLIHQLYILGAEQQIEINALQHRFKGICRYLKIEHEVFLKEDHPEKADLLSNLYALQNLLKGIKIEVL